MYWLLALSAAVGAGLLFSSFAVGKKEEEEDASADDKATTTRLGADDMPTANLVIAETVSEQGELDTGLQGKMDKLWDDSSFITKDIIRSGGEKLDEKMKGKNVSGIVALFSGIFENAAIQKVDSWANNEQMKRRIINKAVNAGEKVHIEMIYQLATDIFKK